MYKVHIRNNDTGEVRIANMDLEWHKNSIFWWGEGNMACDCNRYLEFLRAGGEVDIDIDCSRGMFSVILFELENGEFKKLENEKWQKEN